MKLSIIMPAYNSEKFIEKTIGSILSQTFTDYELLCTDDGSTDSTGKILDEFAKNDSRVKVFHQPRNMGIEEARKRCLENCAGEYIGFVDSDDILHPQMYELMFEAAEKHNADIVMCEYLETAEGEEIQFEPLEYDEEKVSVVDMDERYRRMNSRGRECMFMTALWNKIYRSELFMAALPDRPTEDLEINVRALHRTEELLFVDYPLYFYTYIDNSSSHRPSWWHQLLEYRFRIDEYITENLPKYADATHIRTFKHVLSTRENTKDTLYAAEAKKVMKKHFKPFKKRFMSADGIGFATKAEYMLMYRLPFLYRMIRNLTDSKDQ